MRPRILIADDHVLVAEALARMFEGEYDFIAQASDGREMIAKAEELHPDLVIADITMPGLNGVEAARQLKRIRPDIKILFLSMHSDVSYISEALRVGAAGYVLKRSPPEELAHAIREIMEGRVYITPLISSQAVQAAGKQRDVLTARQREVLQLVAEGFSAKEIAHALRVSVKTAEFHKAGIMQKLGIRSTAELTKYALEHGITGK